MAEALTSKRKIMRYAGGSNVTMKLAARNLDQIGYIKSHLGIVVGEYEEPNTDVEVAC